MKRAWSTLPCAVSIALCGAISCSAQQQEAIRKSFLLIMRPAIEQKANDISFSLKKRRVIRASLITLSAAMFFNQGCNTLKGWFVAEKKSQSAGEQANQQDAAPAEAQPAQTFCRGGWLKSGKLLKGVGSAGLHFAATIAAGQVLQIVLGKYIVPDTLSWFVHVQAPYRKVMLEIDAHASSLGQALAERSDERVAYHLQAIDSAYRALVLQLTDVLGYMCFRSHELLSPREAEATQLIEHLVGAINECSLQLDDLLAGGGGIDSHQLLRFFDTLGTEIDAGCLYFSRLEGSVWHDGGYVRRVARQGKAKSDVRGLA